jgi:hypothetical protein
VAARRIRVEDGMAGPGGRWWGSRAPRTRDRRGLGWSIKISIAHTKLLVCFSNFK